jgi:hypothetical protein
MTSHYEEREEQLPAKVVTAKVLTKITCDWCGKVIWDEKGPTKIAFSTEITNDENFECRFVTNSGTGIYLIGSGWEIEDICKPCVGRFKKLLQDQGIKLSEVDY